MIKKQYSVSSIWWKITITQYRHLYHESLVIPRVSHYTTLPMLVLLQWRFPLGVADCSKHIGLFSNLDLNILREVPFPMPTEIMTQNKNGTILHSYTSIKGDRQPRHTSFNLFYWGGGRACNCHLKQAEFSVIEHNDIVIRVRPETKSWTPQSKP